VEVIRDASVVVQGDERTEGERVRAAFDDIIRVQSVAIGRD